MEEYTTELVKAHLNMKTTRNRLMVKKHRKYKERPKE